MSQVELDICDNTLGSSNEVKIGALVITVGERKCRLPPDIFQLPQSTQATSSPSIKLRRLIAILQEIRAYPWVHSKDIVSPLNLLS